MSDDRKLTQPHTVYLTPVQAQRLGRYFEQGGIKVVIIQRMPTTRHGMAKEAY